MEIEFDEAKNKRNILERGLSFERVSEIDFNEVVIYPDNRNDYGEIRYIGLCYLDKRLHILVFTEVKKGIRVISLRKANNREVTRYGKLKVID